jgi:hypothetical protein
MIFMAHQVGHKVTTNTAAAADPTPLRMLMGVGTALLLAVLGA